MMLMLFFGCVYIDNKFGLLLYLDYDLNSGDTDVYDDAVQASGREEIKQLYLEAEQLLVWVTYKYKLKQKKHFFDPGDRGEREPRKVGWSSEHNGGCGQIPGGWIFIL